ncbi:MAG: hypothetical protein WC415_02130 [Patescibacteria group bacterium]|jgi:cytoskeletal protein RodZ
MFENLDKKPDTGSTPQSFTNPPAPTEDIFNGLKESVLDVANDQGAGNSSSSRKNKPSNLVNILVAILILLIVIAAGLVLASNFLGFTGLSQLKDEFFPSSGQEIIINNENQENIGEQSSIEIKDVTSKENNIEELTASQNETQTVSDGIYEAPIAENIASTTFATSTDSTDIVAVPIDIDKDGLSDLDESLAGTDPAKVDTDGDGLSDGDEVNIFNTSPLKPDTDDDNLSDYDEVKVYLTDPNNPDTDADTYLDGNEVTAGYNPKGPGELIK